MDSDSWISRLPMKKRHDAHHQYLQGSSSDLLGFQEFKVEEEMQSAFRCPYCYEDHGIVSLCLHLGDEHPFESTIAVCPICSVKVSKDMLNHIRVHHKNLFNLQSRRRLRRFGIPRTQTHSLLERDAREAHLQEFLGSGGYRSNNNSASNLAADSLLSSLILNFPTFEADEMAKSFFSTVGDVCNKKDSPLPAWKTSLESSLTCEERERRRKHATVRATFVQDLLLSTLFGN